MAPCGMVTKALLVGVLSSILTGCVVGKDGVDKSPCLSAIDSHSSPSHIYQQMNQCIRHAEFESGALLFSLAGTYTWYDAMRVGGREAQLQHQALLAKSLQGLSQTQITTFWEQVHRSLGNKTSLDRMCSRVAEFGQPQYVPQYTLSPDFIALSQPTDGLWKQALQAYLHCPLS